MRSLPCFSLILAMLVIMPAFAVGANSEGEEVPAEEGPAIKRVTDMIAAQVQSGFDKDGHAFRDAHHKQHGCVRAQFTVEDGLAPNLKQALFAHPGSYSAVIRYSNGSGEVKDDHDGDGRGMAVKVLGVKGDRNLHEADDEATSQDFMMINHNVFFVRDAASYVDFQKSPLWFIVKHPFHEGSIARAIQGKKMLNPLESDYFSMTASKLGETQMKFRTTPCSGAKFVSPSDSANRLRENLEATLSSGNGCFLFQVQPRTKPESMPVEDPSMEWLEGEKGADFVTVAKINIPRQKPMADLECEALSFNPWNGLAALRPLGGISRTRKEVYQTISRLRHKLNKQARAEAAPTGTVNGVSLPVGDLKEGDCKPESADCDKTPSAL